MSNVHFFSYEHTYNIVYIMHDVSYEIPILDTCNDINLVNTISILQPGKKIFLAIIQPSL